MVARYRLKDKIFLRDALLEAGTEIDYDGPPNEAMEPLNDEAREAKAQVREEAESRARALKAGIGQTSDPAILETLARLEARVAEAETKLGFGAALKERVERSEKDIEELDQGLQLILDRVERVEATISAASAAPVAPAPAPAPAPQEPVAPPAAPEEPAPPSA